MFGEYIYIYIYICTCIGRHLYQIFDLFTRFGGRDEFEHVGNRFLHVHAKFHVNWWPMNPFYDYFSILKKLKKGLGEKADEMTL